MPLRSWILAGLLLAAVALLVAQTAQKHTLMQEDVGLYNTALSAPHTLTSATLTQAITDMGSSQRTLWLTNGTWALTTNHTIPANLQLSVPYGTKVSLAAGITLTLAGCPQFGPPGWLIAGAGAKVNVTATGCPIDVYKFITGGSGTITDPWTGWDSALTWASGAAGGTVFATATARDYRFKCGVYKQTAMITLPGHFNTVRGETHGGWACATITYEPIGSADADGYYTAWTFGNTLGQGGVWYHRFENLWLTSADLTKKKRGLYFADARDVTIRNVWITGNANNCSYSGSPALTGIAWCDSVAFDSVGVFIRGREFIKIEDSHIFANHPLYIAGTPAVYAGPPYTNGIPHNLDVTSLHNIELVQIPSTHPTNLHNAAIEMDPNIFLTNFDISGTCSLIGGRHSIYMDQSTRSSTYYEASHTLSVANCRPEGNETNDYRFVFKGLAGITVNNWQGLFHGVTFRNIPIGGGGSGQGFYLQDVAYVTFDTVHYENSNPGYHPENANVAVHLGPGAYPVTFLSTFLPNASFMEVAGKQCMTFNSGKNSRLGPMGGAALVVFDVIDDYSAGGCPQITTPTGSPPTESGPVVAAAIPFQPHVQYSGSVSGVTYTDRSGYWTRAGKLVQVYMRVNLSNKGTGSGLVSIELSATPGMGDLPPPPTDSAANFNQGLQLHYANITLPSAAVTALVPYVPPGQKNVLFRYQGTGIPDGTYLNAADLTNTTL